MEICKTIKPSIKNLVELLQKEKNSKSKKTEKKLKKSLFFSLHLLTFFFSFANIINVKRAAVAQLVEQWTENPSVVGSIPTGGTNTLQRNL